MHFMHWFIFWILTFFICAIILACAGLFVIGAAGNASPTSIHEARRRGKEHGQLMAAHDMELFLNTRTLDY